MIKVCYKDENGKKWSDQIDTNSILEAIHRCEFVHGVLPYKILRLVEGSSVVIDKGGYVGIVESGDDRAFVFFNTYNSGFWEVFFRNEYKSFDDYNTALEYAKQIIERACNYWELIDEITEEKKHDSI